MKCVAVILISFSAVIPTATVQSEIVLKASSDQVGQYAKMDFTIAIENTFKNPFDPQQSDIVLLIKGPEGQSVSVPAFWYQDFERIPIGDNKGASVFCPLNNGSWKARYAAARPGRYQAIAQWNNLAGCVVSNTIEFEITPSADPGFVGIHKTDPRFFQFTNGDFFFPIGQNVAFIGESQYVNLTKADAIFKAMAENGANFARVWACCEDWAIAIEARKSAFDRSWARQPNQFVPLPDDTSGRKCVRIGGSAKPALTVDPSHPVALRPSTAYTLIARLRSDKPATVQIRFGRQDKSLALDPAEGWVMLDHRFTTDDGERSLGRITLTVQNSATVWLDGLSLTEAAGGPELLWEADVNRPARGVYNQIDCFMLDQVVRSAEQHGIYLMLCLITRDLYMDDLKTADSDAYRTAVRDAQNLLRYAVARWGYSSHVAAWEYFNEIDPGLPTDRFYSELANYLDKVDPYRHLRTTSTWSPSSRDCQLPALDIAQIHHYMRPSDKDKFRDQFTVLIEKSNWLRQYAPAKPATLGEFGLADDKWGLSPYLNQDPDCIHFETSLWAAAFAGGSGTDLFWWWDQLDRQKVYPHYRPLAEYMRGVSFAGMQSDKAVISGVNLDALGYQSDKAAYLWIFDHTANWSSRIIEKQPPRIVAGARLSIHNLPAGTYSVEWWDTRSGKVIQQMEVNIPQEIQIPPFSSDIACKVQMK